jgi:hypothetical protein
LEISFTLLVCMATLYSCTARSTRASICPGDRQLSSCSAATRYGNILSGSTCTLPKERKSIACSTAFSWSARPIATNKLLDGRRVPCSRLSDHATRFVHQIRQLRLSQMTVLLSKPDQEFTATHTPLCHTPIPLEISRCSTSLVAMTLCFWDTWYFYYLHTTQSPRIPSESISWKSYTRRIYDQASFNNQIYRHTIDVKMGFIWYKESRHL